MPDYNEFFCKLDNEFMESQCESRYPNFFFKFCSDNYENFLIFT